MLCKYWINNNNLLYETIIIVIKLDLFTLMFADDVVFFLMEFEWQQISLSL